MLPYMKLVPLKALPKNSLGNRLMRVLIKD